MSAVYLSTSPIMSRRYTYPTKLPATAQPPACEGIGQRGCMLIEERLHFPCSNSYLLQGGGEVMLLQPSNLTNTQTWETCESRLQAILTFVRLRV